MNMKKQILFIFSFLVIILTGCGKYENGPGFSLRSKNARLSGKWKVVKYEYNLINSTDASQNSSSILNGNLMTETDPEAVYDPVDGSFIGYVPVSTTYTYSSTWEIETKDNSVKRTYSYDGSTSVITSLWSWNDGVDNQEILEIFGEESSSRYIIKRLTNKEMELFREYTEDDETERTSITLEKQ